MSRATGGTSARDTEGRVGGSVRQRTDGALDVLQLTTNAEATYVRNQVDALRELGVESDVVEVPRSGSADGRSPLDYVRFCPIVRDRLSSEHDLVHANFGLTIPGALSQRRVPTVTSLVGTDLMGRFGPVTRSLARFCDEVIVVNERMRELVPRDAEVIPHGIDAERFRPIDRATAREAVGWPTEGYQVLFPYHPDRTVKNYPLAERVVEAAADRIDESIALRVITGTEYAEMPYYMNAADALLLTSRREGSPSTVKEALACNTPVIATPVGDVPERLSKVRLSATGGTVEALADALVRALDADDQPNGRDAIRDVRLERMAERILDVYERAIE